MNDIALIPEPDGRSPALPQSVGVTIAVPRLIAEAGPVATTCFLTFFTATIENINTARAYLAAGSRFLAWCESQGLTLRAIDPIAVAAYRETLKADKLAPATVKQHLAAIRMLLDGLVTGKVLDLNPAAAVRGPKLVVTKGKTPVLTASEARQLLDSIPLKVGPQPPEGEEDRRPPDLTGLRDRAIIAAMVYSFARVSAIVGMDVEDYYQEGKRSWLRLAEKGGKAHAMPAHHNSEKYLDEYIEAAGIAGQPKSPLFRSASGRRTTTLSANRMSRNDVFRMIRRRAKVARLPARICCHSFRATGITTYLENGGTLEKAQQMAAHASTKTTKLYDRRSDAVTLDEVERIII